MSADQRREEVLRAATTEFAARGYEGTTTEAIARVVGVSQPYLFRLFKSKHDLFLATLQHVMEDLEQEMRGAAEGLPGDEALAAIGDRYRELVADTDWLRFQLHLYAIAVHDEACRTLASRGLANLWQAVAESTGASPEQVLEFFSRGMLVNVLTALGVPYGTRTELAPSLADWAEGAAPRSVS